MMMMMMMMIMMVMIVMEIGNDGCDDNNEVDSYVDDLNSNADKNNGAAAAVPYLLPHEILAGTFESCGDCLEAHALIFKENPQ